MWMGKPPGFMCCPTWSGTSSLWNQSWRRMGAAGLHGLPYTLRIDPQHRAGRDESSPWLRCHRFPLFLLRFSRVSWINASQFIAVFYFPRFFTVLPWRGLAEFFIQWLWKSQLLPHVLTATAEYFLSCESIWFMEFGGISSKFIWKLAG